MGRKKITGADKVTEHVTAVWDGNGAYGGKQWQLTAGSMIRSGAG